MSEVIVTESYLGDIAEAIRAKNGTQNTYKPSQMAAAITALPSGGTIEPLSVTENGTYTAEQGKAYSPVTVTVPSMPDETLQQILERTIVKFENNYSGAIKSRGLLWNQNNLTEINMPNCTQLGGNAASSVNNFAYECSNLTKISLPKVKMIFGDRAFSVCISLVHVVLPSLYWIYGQRMFESDGNLEKVDLGNSSVNSTNSTNRNIDQFAFKDCSKLDTVVLRHNVLIPISNTNVFANTPFRDDTKGGTLYVPQALISDYQNATNWSIILGYANTQIKSIESTHTDPTAPIDLTLYYADGTPISA